MSDPIPLEQWRPIPGEDGYELSSRGRVRSYWSAPSSQTPQPRLLKIRSRGARRNVQIRKRHYDIDVLMQTVWGVTTRRPHRPLHWRRVMLTSQQHVDLLDILQSSSDARARALFRSVRSARHVAWDEPISPHELGEDSCAD